MTAQFGPWIDAALGGVVTPEARLAVTVGILLLTVGIGWLLLPRAVRTAERLLVGWLERFLDDRGESSVETLREAVPVSFGLRLFVGLLQFALFALAAVAVLTLWGQFAVVVAVLPVAEDAATAIGRGLLSALLLGGAYVASDVLEEYVSALSDDSDRITAHQEQLLTRIMQVGLLAVAGVTVLGIWGVNLGGLLVGAGFLGIVLGMAARQTLGSLIAGFVLMFARPFEIGDWVAIGEEEGFVTDITIMNTHMRNFDGEYVVVPNDLVTNQAITNRAARGGSGSTWRSASGTTTTPTPPPRSPSRSSKTSTRSPTTRSRTRSPRASATPRSCSTSGSGSTRRPRRRGGARRRRPWS